MPWFFYSGNIPRPVPIKKGVSIALVPHTKVEIVDANSPEVQALKRKGLLRVTGKPASAVSLAKVEAPVETVADVTPKSDMARSIAEKGVSKGKGETPKKAVGNPEMTEGELVSSEKKVDVVEVLSKAVSSPDEEKGKKKANKKGK